MTAFRKHALTLILVLACSGAMVPSAFAQPAQEQQEGFIPISELPPQDQLAAAPLLIAAYSFVGVALFLYLLSIARRLTAVQREMERLEADIRRSARS